MGTNGTFGFVKGGKVKSTYKQFDSYPEGLGQKVLDYARNRSITRLHEVFSSLQMVGEQSRPSEEDIERWTQVLESRGMPVHPPTNWYWLARGANGYLDVYEELGQMPSADGMYEWTYYINLDTNTFDIYQDGKLASSFLLEKLPEKLDIDSVPQFFLPEVAERLRDRLRKVSESFDIALHKEAAGAQSELFLRVNFAPTLSEERILVLVDSLVEQFEDFLLPTLEVEK